MIRLKQILKKVIMKNFPSILGSGNCFFDNYQLWLIFKRVILFLNRRNLISSTNHFTSFPKISIILPTYNSNLQFLRKAIDSVLTQNYPHWELCVIDDCSNSSILIQFLKELSALDSRIKVYFRLENGHISKASNDGIKYSTGEYISFLDHDDVLERNALFRVVEAINKYPKAVLFYSDEDKLNRFGIRVSPHFKPDWNYDLFLGYNYLCHFVVIKKGYADLVGGFREGYEGAQDYDFLLRIIEKIDSSQIIHIPEILYHWRMIKGSTSLNQDEKSYAKLATEKLLMDHFNRLNIDASLRFFEKEKLFQPVYFLPKKEPLVSIIIPTRDRYKLVKICIESLIKFTKYSKYEIILIDNGSQEFESLNYFDSLKTYDSRIKIVRHDRPFNFSELNNIGARNAKGDILLLLNNDTEIFQPDWLTEMVSVQIQNNVGIVGAKLLYSDNLVQHAGVLIGTGGVAGQINHLMPGNASGYFNRAIIRQSFSAVTGACLMIPSILYQKVGGLNEEKLAVAFNDIDLCLKVKQLGLRVVWTPHAVMYHHESLSRGQEDTLEKKKRFQSEVNYMISTWSTDRYLDPAYNPNLNRSKANFYLNWSVR